MPITETSSKILSPEVVKVNSSKHITFNWMFILWDSLKKFVSNALSEKCITHFYSDHQSNFNAQDSSWHILTENYQAPEKTRKERSKLCK